MQQMALDFCWILRGNVGSTKPSKVKRKASKASKVRTKAAKASKGKNEEGFEGFEWEGRKWQYIWEKEAIEARSKISQKRPKSGLFEPERLRGHYAVTTRSLRGHSAVTTRSLRGHYAVTTLYGHYAVTTRTLRGQKELHVRG